MDFVNKAVDFLMSFKLVVAVVVAFFVVAVIVVVVNDLALFHV